MQCWWWDVVLVIFFYHCNLYRVYFDAILGSSKDICPYTSLLCRRFLSEGLTYCLITFGKSYWKRMVWLVFFWNDEVPERVSFIHAGCIARPYIAQQHALFCLWTYVTACSIIRCVVECCAVKVTQHDAWHLVTQRIASHPVWTNLNDDQDVNVSTFVALWDHSSPTLQMVRHNAIIISMTCNGI